MKIKFIGRYSWQEGTLISITPLVIKEGEDIKFMIIFNPIETDRVEYEYLNSLTQLEVYD